MHKLPVIGETVIVPYLYGMKDRRLIVERISDKPCAHAGIPGSPLVLFASGKHPRSGKSYDFHIYPDTGFCAC